jgi:hypothetical protein
MTPAAVATPFPPLKPTKTEKTCPTIAAMPQLSQHHHRNEALGNVYQCGWYGILPPEHAIQIRGTQVTTALLAEIDACKEATEEVTRRNGTEKVGSDQPEHS